jgi:epoxyqueuosine reductase
MSDIGKSLRMPEIEWLASLSQPEFSVLFRGSAVKRAKWRGLVRNACLALGNSALPAGQPGHARALRLLERLAASEDSVISELARWALGRLSGSETTGTSVGLEKSTLWGETNSKTQ